MTERLKIRETNSYSADVRSCNTLKEIKDHVEALINKFGEDAEYSMDATWDGGYITEEITTYRDETDSEYHERVNTEYYRKQLLEQREKAELERLKAKYEQI